MNEKQMSNKLLLIIIVGTIIFTILNLKILDLFLIIIGCQKISNKITAIFSIFILSYSIMLYIKPILVRKLELQYVKRKEKFDNDIEIKYYRELIEKYSIGTLVKCYGEKVDYKDQLVSTLIRLVINKKIKIENQNIEIIDEKALSPSEDMFIKSCKDCIIYTKKNIKNQINEDNDNDALQTDLFNKDVVNSSNIEWKSIKFGLVLWFLNFLALFISPIIYKDNALALIIISFISHFLTIIILMTGSNRKIIYRTEKGKEIQHKLIGLKNFLKEYSNINDKKIEEIKIWDEYIIYAIIFNLKGNLNREAYDVYKKYIENMIY